MLGAYVTRSIFQQRSEKRTSQASIELLNFFKHRPPTAICLIERTADNLINFQALVKKRLSKFELLKCCRIFQQLSQKDFVSNKKLFMCSSKFPFQYKTDYCTTELCACNEACSTLCEKREFNFSFDTFHTFIARRSYNQSNVIVMSSQKQPSLGEQSLLRKLYVRMRSANRFQNRLYYVAYCFDHTAAHIVDRGTSSQEH